MNMQTASPAATQGPIHLLTEQQAAALAGVSKKTIRRLIEQGRLKACDFGTGTQHNYRVHPDELFRVASIPLTNPEPTQPSPQVRPRRRQPASPVSDETRVW